MREVQDRYDSADFSEWIAFERLFGPLTLHERLDHLFAHLMLIIASIHSDPKKSRPQYDQFLPWWTKPRRRKQTVEEMYQLMHMLAS